MARRLSGLNDPFFDRHKSKNWTQNHHAEHRKGSNAKGPLQGMEAIRMAFKSQHTHCSSAPGHRDHQDQSFGGINRVPAHVPLRALDSFVNARHARIEEGPRDSNYFRLLTPAGTKWKFKFLPSADLAPMPDSSIKGFKGADSWGDIPVPCSWECAGHGQAIYTNFIYPFKCDPPNIPDGVNHVGCYQTSISVPSSWEGRRHFLVFEGVSAAFHCWLDGEFVGYSSDSFCPTEFDVTRFVRAGGEHVLSVRVLRYCEGSYMESQDMWWLSGIQRDVMLYSKPARAHIWDYKVTTEVYGPEEARQAELAIEVQVNGHSGSGKATASGHSVKATLIGPHCLEPGETAAVPPSECEAVFEDMEVGLVALRKNVFDQPAFADAPTAVCVGQAATVVTGVKPWTADTPWLYTLVLVLEDVNGAVVDVEVTRVGMRTVKIIEGVLTVNGEAIEVRGVNRHEHNDSTGKFCDRELMVKDITLMKQLNFNSVRCSHYPNRSLWYDLCTAYGLWVVNEANLETNGLVAFVAEDFLAQDRTWERAYLDRMTRMVLRDRSHACVIIWSLGNESSYGRNIDALARWTRKMDTTRPIQYESCGGNSATDIICPMYPSLSELQALGTCLGSQNHKSTAIARRWPQGTAGRLRPVILCEYAHAMNNSLGNLDEYWAVIRAHKHLQGGFIWDWVDQGLLTTDSKGRAFWGYGGDFGEHVHDNDWHINGLCWPDRSFHPTVWQVKKTQQPVRLELSWAGKPKRLTSAASVAVMTAHLSIANLGRFCGLDGMGWTWKVEVDGEVLSESTEAQELRLKPTHKTSASIEFQVSGADVAEGKEAVLTVQVVLLCDETWAPAGHQVAWEQSKVPARAEIVAAESDEGKMEVSETRHEVVVESKGMKAVFNRAEGGLQELWVGGGRIVGGEDKVSTLQNFWRAQTSNDNGGSDTLQRYGATEQMYPPEAGFGKLFPRSKAIIRNVVSWLHYWGDISYGGQWEKAGLNRLRPEDIAFTVLRRNLQGKHPHVWGEGPGSAVGVVKVEVRYTLRARGTGTQIPCRTTYCVAPSGEMVLHNECYYSTKLPPPARIGLEMQVPGALTRLKWYGRAEESYPDRLGVPLGQYEEAVDDTFVRYIVPQENGNKCETRWAAVVSEGGRGLVVSKAQAGETFSLSAHRFRAMDLFTSRHCKDVVQRRDVTLTIDHHHTATGGNTSWTRSQLPQFLVPRGTHSYSIRLTPVASEDEAHRPPPLSEALAADVQASKFKAPAPFVQSSHKTMLKVSQGIGHSPIALVESILEVFSWRGTPVCLGILFLLVITIGGFLMMQATIH